MKCLYVQFYANALSNSGALKSGWTDRRTDGQRADRQADMTTIMSKLLQLPFLKAPKCNEISDNPNTGYQSEYVHD